jgi:hypothetical protein
VQITVEFVDPGARRQRAGGAVLFERAEHLPGGGADEHGEGVVRADALHARQQDPAGRAGFRGGPYRGDGALGMGLARGGGLIRHRRL